MITPIIYTRRTASPVCYSERFLSWCTYYLTQQCILSLLNVFSDGVILNVPLSIFLFIFSLVFPLFPHAVSCCLWSASQCSWLTVWTMTYSLPTSLWIALIHQKSLCPMPSFQLTSAVPGDCLILFNSASVTFWGVQWYNCRMWILYTEAHVIKSFHTFSYNDKYFLLQHPRQCICHVCADYFWGVLATPPHQIHLQRLLLLGDQVLLHQRAQDDHGESDFFLFFSFLCQHIKYNCAWSISFVFFQSELPYATWQEVQARIVEIQKEHQICIHKKELTELDIYHRILRFKNYMVCCLISLTSGWENRVHT